MKCAANWQQHYVKCACRRHLQQKSGRDEQKKNVYIYIYGIGAQLRKQCIWVVTALCRLLRLQAKKKREKKITRNSNYICIYIKKTGKKSNNVWRILHFDVPWRILCAIFKRLQHSHSRWCACACAWVSGLGSMKYRPRNVTN